jgi:hypothetical protein
MTANRDSGRVLLNLPPELKESLQRFRNLTTDEEVLEAFAESGLMMIGRPPRPGSPEEWRPEDRESLKRTWGLTSDAEVNEVLRLMDLVTMVVGDLAKAARETTHPLLVAKAVSGVISGLEAQLREVVPILRERGCSWTQIGAALGITKQSAWERFSGED